MGLLLNSANNTDSVQFTGSIGLFSVFTYFSPGPDMTYNVFGGTLNLAMRICDCYRDLTVLKQI